VKHQLLVYISLLETTKPYLMQSIRQAVGKDFCSASLTAQNSLRTGKNFFSFFRVPALAALLLFSHSMETTGDVSRIIFDSWLEVKFADPEAGQNQLITAVKIRHGACAKIGKQRYVSAFCGFRSWPFVLEQLNPKKVTIYAKIILWVNGVVSLERVCPTADCLLTFECYS